MRNPFTKHNVPHQILDASYNITLQLTVHDEPYFAIRSHAENIKITSDGFKDPFKSITTKPVFAKIDTTSGGLTNINRELDFLHLFKLVVEQNNEIYVHKKAKETFYDPATGVYVKGSSPVSLKDLLRSYTLPGRFWAAYYPRLYLPDTIELANRLDTELVEVEEEMMDLDDHDFTLPKVD
jgi:hypothetical protein